MRPVGEPLDVVDYHRLQTMCEQSKGISCRLSGPLILRMTMGDQTGEVEARPGERAHVGPRGSTIFCRDPRAVKEP